jgi:undecaprenyl diphosphate synthase
MKGRLPEHVAIILDGNGRWAARRGNPRSYGHYRGAQNALDVARLAQASGIKVLTLFAFSTENWKRPEDEVRYIMEEPVRQFEKHRERLGEIDYKVSFIGRRDRLPAKLLEVMETIERETAGHRGFELVIAVDYGGRDDIGQACEKACSEGKSVESGLMLQKDVDLLIRTGGEKRLSNFLLWQSAYAELVFLDVMWPAFGKRHFKKAIGLYRKRDRRFGGQ